MLTRVDLRNFGPLDHLSWSDLGPINLILGANGTGKTILLKSLYSVLRTLEEFERGQEPRTVAEILFDKLYWTFQANKIGDLVTKGASEPLSFKAWLGRDSFRFGFGKDTKRQISDLENKARRRESRAIFLPAKEVLSLHHVILKSRDQDQDFGFDDTYLDLARALQLPTTQGKNYKEFADSRRQLEDILGGRVELDDTSGTWEFKKGQQKFPIGVTAEGIKKIAILDTLLGNRYLDPKSILFIDEPESALHPVAISKLLDIVALLSQRGMQFFLASHSYFVVKKLALIAKEQQVSVPVLSAGVDGWQSDDLLDGMPDNSIIDESIRLYREDLELALG